MTTTPRYNSWFMRTSMSRRGASATALWLVLSAALAHGQAPLNARAQESLTRAISLFSSGRAAESATEFDGLVKVAPDSAPYLWQRGIAQYYAGRYGDCRAQFEIHRKVNPDDVENAAWHFLCVARAESPERARAAILPVGPDPRAPMTDVYQMFRGARTPEQVIAVAGTRTQARFYALLYAGLYSEAIGNQRQALEYIKAAAEPQFEAAGGYMHIVARVHLQLARQVK
jgi:lipoprotein NlpI